MKTAMWTSATLLFNGVSIVMFGLIFYRCVHYLGAKFHNAEYIVRIIDYRKRERLNKQQGKRLGIILPLAIGSLFMACMYTFTIADSVIDNALVLTEHATWGAFVIYVIANSAQALLLSSVLDMVDLFTEEERGEYEDGLKVTYDEIREFAGVDE